IMVKKEAFANPITGWFLRKVCAFPIDRQNPDAATLRYSLKVLQQGMVLGLFPEGTRNRKGLIRPFKPGAIRLALKQKAPIVPAFLANTHRIMPDGTWVPRPVPVSMKFGEPLDTKKMLEEGKTEEDMLKILYERVCALGRELTGCDVQDHSTEEPEEPTQAQTQNPVAATE
ncbi:MAG TPA: lysophospholipid acyltransferase family protein, partial [Candidatus Ozemobacteraceae bacterium]|nr:lysophospholipid acyltransferase family protein [Candidatus Ozemobacteraceae bacterium]